MPDSRRHASRTTRMRLSLALLLLLGASGCGGGVAPGGSTGLKSPEENATMDRSPSTSSTALQCGRPFRLPSGGGLSLTGRFPSVVSSSEQTVSGTVEVASENEDVRGVITSSADVFLVWNGRIATLPLPQDLVGMRLELGPGKVEKLSAQAALSPCDPGAGAANGSLRPGSYELYARVVLNHDDGSSLESIGGPWPLEVR